MDGHWSAHASKHTNVHNEHRQMPRIPNNNKVFFLKIMNTFEMRHANNHNNNNNSNKHLVMKHINNQDNDNDNNEHLEMGHLNS